MQRNRSLGRLLVLGIAAASVLSGCSSTLLSGGVAVKTVGSLVHPSLAISLPNNASNVQLDAPVTVTATHGTIAHVYLSVKGQETSSMPGSVNAQDTVWTSTGNLAPTTTYLLEASATNPAGDVSTKEETFTTLTPPKRLLTGVTPVNGATVGIGMVIMLHFNTSIPDSFKAGITSHITIETSTPMVGAWRWVTPWDVHWRPENYWTPGTHVIINAHLDGVDAGNGYYGLGNWTSSFTIGAAHITYVDETPGVDTAKVYNNGQLVYTFPISGGTSKYPTIQGTLMVYGMTYNVLMDSRTIGIPLGAPGSYYEHVFWDTAVSTDGYYMHAAPWNNELGVANISHGCINMSTADAETFFKFSQVGDLVIVSHTILNASYADGEGDWNTPFASYGNYGNQSQTTTPIPA
ncbi:MAG: Ig-like domain-containing protein [Candidatus Dormibacteria bacterium]